MEKKSANQLKIAITGPESTGKTALAMELARHYSGVYVPEYSRVFLDATNGIYTEGDLYTIARGQVENEQKFGNGSSLLFCDTELTVIKIWASHKYRRVDARIEALSSKTTYDFYLLCYPDIPWTSDPLRENPDKGVYFFNKFKAQLDELQAPCFIVRGEGTERLENSIEALNAFFSTKST